MPGRFPPSLRGEASRLATGFYASRYENHELRPDVADTLTNDDAVRLQVAMPTEAEINSGLYNWQR